MKKIILIFFFGLSFQFAKAQNPIPEYTSQKGLIVLRVVPKDRTAKVYLAGLPAAALDLKKDAKLLSVSLLQGKQKVRLQMDPSGDYYEVRNLPAASKPYELEFDVQVQGEPQQMRLEINSTKP